jgi:hypothetical protein
VSDFQERPTETWKYILEISQVQWINVTDKIVNDLLVEKYNQALFKMQDL